MPRLPLPSVAIITHLPPHTSLQPYYDFSGYSDIRFRRHTALGRRPAVGFCTAYLFLDETPTIFRSCRL